MILPVVASALVVDTATAGLLQVTGVGGERVREWYRTLRIGAYSMDVLSLVIGAYVAMRLAPHSLWMQLGVVVAIQMAHDLAFGAFVQSSAAKGPLFALFRRYANEHGFNILWVDAMMVVATVLLANVLQTRFGSDDTAFIAALAAYIGCLVVYSF